MSLANPAFQLGIVYSPRRRPGPIPPQIVLAPVVLPVLGGTPLPGAPAALPRPSTACPNPLLCTLPGLAANQRLTMSGVRI